MRREVTVLTDDAPNRTFTVINECACETCLQYRYLFEDATEMEAMRLRVEEYRRIQRIAEVQRAEEAERRYREEIRRQEENDKNRQFYNRRAKELFLSMLTPEELSFFEDNGCLRFISQSGKQFIIREGYSGNVTDDHKSYCCYIDIYHHSSSMTWYPHWDHMVAQLVNLRWNEEYFLSKAY